MQSSYSLGYDGSLLNGLQALPAWQTKFDHPTGTRLGLIAASYYLCVLHDGKPIALTLHRPKIPATFIIAWLVDHYGRKIPLVSEAKQSALTLSSIWDLFS